MTLNQVVVLDHLYKGGRLGPGVLLKAAVTLDLLVFTKLLYLLHCWY